MVALVAAEAGFQSFFLHEAQGFTQGVVHRDRSGVVIDPFLTPILFDHSEVEIPTLDLRLARAEGFLSRRTKGHWRKAGRAAQTFLRPAVTRIDPPGIDLQRAASQRG